MIYKFDIQVFNAVDYLGKDFIDSVSDDPLYTYGWFKTLEEQKRFKSLQFYIGVYYKDKLVAFAPCFFESLEQQFKRIKTLSELMKIGSKFNLWNKHVLVCHSPYCFRSSIPIDKDFKNPYIYILVLRKIDEICKKRRILFSAFPYVYESDTLLSKILNNSGYLKLLSQDTFDLDICWTSFEDYLTSLRYNYRKDIRREIRKFDQSGVVIETNPEIPQLSQRLSALLSKVLHKYESNLSAIGPSFFTNLSIFAGDKIKLLAAKKGSEIVAFCLILRHKDIAEVCMFGTDYNYRTKTDFAYFNLVYYEPIKWAIEENIRKIHYGPSAENVKLRLGCKSEKISLFIKCQNKILANFYRAYVKKKFYR